MPINELWGTDWSEIRSNWELDPDFAHLNHGSYGAVPKPVLERQAQIRAQAEGNPHDFHFRELHDQINAARAIAADFIGAELDSFSFVRNASIGVSAVLRSLHFDPTDEILVSDQVYGGVYQAVLDLNASTGANLVIQPVDLELSGDDIVKAFLEGVSVKTKVAIVDVIASPTGMIFPVDEIAEELRARGVITIIDGAHAPGMIDLNVKQLGADFWVGNFHKWVCSPRGAAGLVVGPSMRKLIRPAVVSWDQPEGYPTSFEWQGTDDYSAALSVPAAIEFMSSIGWERLRTHNRQLVTLGAELLSQALETPLVDYPDEGFGSMRVVRLPRHVAKDEISAWHLGARISRELNVEVPAIAWREGFIRLSAHVYNHPAEYERLAEGLARLLKAG